ncbi:MAG: hypothetical protein GXP17_11210 [Gammaproteobacteria bacterium]|nr:hypothetical protein [Gammaproteobacteria bacterium]
MKTPAGFARKSLLAALLFPLLIITGCSGGGGGDTPPADSPPVPVSKSVSGTVTQKTGISSVAATDATVTVNSYDSNDVQIDTQNFPIPAGYFSLDLDMIDNGYLVLLVKKAEFTDYAQRIDYDSPADVDIVAELRAVQVVYSTPGQVLKSSGETVRAFSFAVVKYPDGTRKAVAGRGLQAAKAAADTITELEVMIPVGTVPAGTDTLIGRISNFDSSDPADAANFPGDYRDSDGNSLVSLAFDYIDITNGSGENLGALVTAAKASGLISKAAADEPTMITRRIPSGSCSALSIGDMNDSLTGFQVPVYTYSPVSGLWDLLGNGTVVNSLGTMVAAVEVTPENCRSNGFSLSIEIVNEDFLKSWWNLDYPLIFDQPTEVCITKTFEDQDGNPLTGLYVSLNDDDVSSSFSPVYGYTDSNGQVTLTSLRLDNTDTDLAASLTYWSRFDGNYGAEAVTLGEAPNCTQLTNVVTVPRTCNVSGVVTNENGVAKEGVFVWASGALYDYRSDSTDAQGRFDMEVRCETDYTVYTGYTFSLAAQFNVNNTTTDFPAYEQSDDGSALTLKNIQQANNAPYAWGYLSSYSMRSTGSVTAFIYGYDWDGDNPLNYSLDVGGALTLTGSMTGLLDGVWVEQAITGLMEGTYVLSLTVTDSLGAETMVSLGTLTVSDTNQPPIIYYAFPDRTNVGPDDTVNLYAYAYDSDNDPVSYEWVVVHNGSGDGASTMAGNASITSYVIPSTAEDGDTFDVTVTVSDDQGGSATSTFQLILDNSAPVITRVLPGNVNVLLGTSSVDISVAAYDPDGDTAALAYNWTADGVSFATTASATFNIPANAVGGDSYAIQVTVTDPLGAAAVRQFTVSISGTSGSGNVDIIVQ